MILFCLPYGGGSELIYHKWSKYLKPSIHLESIKLKGRGERYDEAFYETLEEAVEDIFKNIKDKILNYDYAIYGHSMGSLLAYELYYKISELNLRKPRHIFFSGHGAPSTIRKKEESYSLSDCDFMKKIIDLGGITDELANNKESLEVFLPIIRNDFKIVENYIYKKRKNNIKCDVSILNGKQECIKQEEILTWENHVEKEIKFYNLEGDHFFINNNFENIINIVNQTLMFNE